MDVRKAVDMVEDGAPLQGTTTALVESELDEGLMLEDIMSELDNLDEVCRLEEGFKSAVGAVVDKLMNIGNSLHKRIYQGGGKKGHREFEALARRFEPEVKKLHKEAESIDDAAIDADEEDIPGLRVRLGRLVNSGKYLWKQFSDRLTKLKKFLPDAVQGGSVDAVRDSLKSANSTLKAASGELGK